MATPLVSMININFMLCVNLFINFDETFNLFTLRNIEKNRNFCFEILAEDFLIILGHFLGYITALGTIS